MSANHLPLLTCDLDQAKADLDEFGYCLVKDALTTLECATTRQRLEEQAAAENQQGLAFRDGGPRQQIVDDFGKVKSDAFTAQNGGVNQRLWTLANKGQCFRDLIIHPLAEELVGHVLGNEYILSTLSANIAKAGGKRMGLHTDQWWMPQPVKRGERGTPSSEITRSPPVSFLEPNDSLGISPAVVCNTMWMLSDFTHQNGATEIVPRGHESGAHPHPTAQDNYPIEQAIAPAGSLMVFDGRLWHGTGANTGSDDRLGVLGTFCAPQFRQQENQTLGLDRSLWDELPIKLKERLGFKVWNAYGRIESPAEQLVSPEPTRIGELNPD